MNKLKTINPPANFVRLGKLGKTFKLSGGIRFYGLAENENDLIFGLQEVFIEDHGQTKILEVAEKGSNIIVYFEIAKNVEDAKKLTNKAVFVAKEELADNPNYVAVIESLPVFLDDEAFGKVKELIIGKQDILRIEGPRGEVLIPANAPYVHISENAIRLKDLPSGLLELNR